MRKLIVVVSIALPALAGCAAAEWQQGLGQVLGAVQQPGGGAALGEAEIIGGLREALAQGTTQAIRQLGRSDGYWGDAGVRIPLPESVQRMEGTLRQLGQGARVDQFHLTLNRAAEQAVPQVADIFGNAVRQMSIQDARSILHGPSDAATQYFRRSSSAALHDKVYPIVQATTRSVGVTQQYKQLVSEYGPLLRMAGVKAGDLDAYVTDRALAGLFTTIATEEARIRRDPAARGTELLRRVFGAQGR